MSHLPALIDKSLAAAGTADTDELAMLEKAAKLFSSDFPDYALLAIWNAAVHNLRRRVEAYGIDLWKSVVKDEAGRKSLNLDGDTLSDRWSSVDDLVLIAGCSRLGVINKKAGKALEMINWMRNHASPAHDSDEAASKEDVSALALLLQKNLFTEPMPERGHSVASLFDPVKKKPLVGESLDLLRDQIEALKSADKRTAFGFMLDLLTQGTDPAAKNVRLLMPALWAVSSDELKKTAGIKYHSLKSDPDSDDSADKGAATRVLDFLVEVKGIEFVPDGARASLYRRAAKVLAKAKDTSYGWADEVAAAETLAQFGPHVPSLCFEEVYQEIIGVWCGNFWGRSNSQGTLRPFMDRLSTRQIVDVAEMFRTNARVRSELFQAKPKHEAVVLLRELQGRLTIKAHRDDVDDAIANLP